MSEYVGSRIVPKPCGEWDKTKEYEVLSVVLLPSSGDSYIARKDTPAGTDIGDEEYWMLCSEFNAQLKALSDTVSAINSSVTKLSSQVAANVSASTDSDADYAAEVVDARIGADGNSYGSLGEAVREQFDRIGLYLTEAFASNDEDGGRNLLDNLSALGESGVTQDGRDYVIEAGGYFFPRVSIANLTGNIIYVVMKVSDVSRFRFGLLTSTTVDSYPDYDVFEVGGYTLVRLEIPETESTGLQLRFDNRSKSDALYIYDLCFSCGFPRVQAITAQDLVAALTDRLDKYISRLSMQGIVLPEKIAATGSGETRAMTEPFSVSAGDVIYLDPTDFYYAIYSCDSDGSSAVGLTTSWQALESYTVVSDGYVYVYARKVDGTAFTDDDIEELEDCVVVKTQQSPASIGDAESITDEKLNEAVNSGFGLYGSADYLALLLRQAYTSEELPTSYAEIGEVTGGTYGARNYSYQSLTEGDILYAILKTDDTDGQYADYIMLRAYPGSVGETGTTQFLGDGDYLIVYEVTETTFTGSILQLLVDFRQLDEDASITVNSSVIGINGLYRESDQEEDEDAYEGELTFYVSTDGDDTNDGSSSAPFATIQAALDAGATTVIVEPGVYRKGVSAIGKDSVRIMMAQGSTYSLTSLIDRPKVIIDGGEDLELEAYEDSILSCAYECEETDNIYKVFISQTLDPVYSTGRSGAYNVTLWEIVDGIEDVKLVPVLTYDECAATAGTWFYDGETIYVNPSEGITDASYTLIPGDISYCIYLLNCRNVVLEDIYCRYANTSCFYVKQCNDVTMRRCFASHAAKGQGFALDYSNGSFYKCEAWKIYNDGFNIHGFGDTHFFDCSGYYNYDDGISHHDGCTGSIIGGEYHHNGKGGVASPTYGAMIDVYDTFCHDNAYGIYAAGGGDGYPERNCRIAGNALYDNTGADFRVSGSNQKVLSVNNKYGTSSFDYEDNVKTIE